MGLSAVFISPQYIDYLIMFSKFFEAMIPVLAVGALIKYLGCPKGNCPHCDKGM
jgi:histone acetyltransferase (RNA polymerase elongator complex component)